MCYYHKQSQLRQSSQRVNSVLLTVPCSQETVLSTIVTLLMGSYKCFWHKTFIAYFTLIWFLPSMVTFVYSQGRALSKRLPTMITGVGFFTSVCTLVNFQVFTRDECLPTHITNIGFFSCVYSNMNHKRCFTRQCLVTNTAHVVTLPCVCSHMQSEWTSLQEHLTTNFTLVFLYR